MVFKSWWLDDNRYKDWLQRGDDPNTAKCRHCKGKPIALTKKFQIGALDSHAESDKHKAAIDNSKRNLERKNSFFGKSQASSSIAKSQASDSDIVVVDVSETNKAELLPTSPADSSSQPSASSQPSSSSNQQSAKNMMNMFRSETREKSELTWILFSVDHNFSDRSSDQVVDVFRDMFPNSFPENSAMSKMSLGRTKVGYTVNYGIAPYVKKLLHEQLDKCRWITVSYDESLNHAAQKGHMDFHLRFWDDEKQQVSTRYYDSHFLGHAKVKDLKDSFE